MNPHDAFDRILAALQRAALDDTLWPATAALIDEACGIVGNGLAVGGGVGDDARVHFAGLYQRGERDRAGEREYFEDYYARDERVPRLRKAPDGQLLHIPRLYGEEELKTSATYNEWGRRQGNQNGLNVCFHEPDGLRIVWGTHDPVASGGWQSAQLELIEALVPHVRHFVRVRHVLANADTLGATLTALLDASRIGVLQLDRSGRLLAANSPALDILRRGDGLSDKDGALHAWLPADHRRLQKLLARALPTLWGRPPGGGSMTLRRPSAPATLSLHVSPVGGARADFGGRRVAALVLLVDPTIPPRLDPVQVAEVFGLTPSEGRVAALLAQGRSVPDIAAATGYRPGYVRQLLKKMYQKQGVSGQVALLPRFLALDVLPRR